MNELICCNEPMSLVAGAHSTRNVSPLAWRLWRCRRCECFEWHLDHEFETLGSLCRLRPPRRRRSSAVPRAATYSGGLLRFSGRGVLLELLGRLERLARLGLCLAQPLARRVLPGQRLFVLFGDD